MFVIDDVIVGDFMVFDRIAVFVHQHPIFDRYRREQKSLSL